MAAHPDKQTAPNSCCNTQSGLEQTRSKIAPLGSDRNVMEALESKTPLLPRHYYSLDALRGVAALIIVFWHWQHFYIQGTAAPDFDPTQQPLFWLFVPFYTEGWRAVDVFFCLSGFIFYWLYSERIWTRATTLKEFFVLRFSRLYPLHFLTLLLVLVGQRVMLRLTGSAFAYDHNDPYHFLLQLMFASNWGFERGYSFNGPVWSVSVEVLIYALFCLVCRLNFRRWWQLVILAISGHLLTRINLGHVGQGVLSFFAGGLAYYAFICIWRRQPSRRALVNTALVTGLLWVLVLANLYVKAAVGEALFKTPRFFFEFLLYPLTLVTLALWETYRGTLGRRVAFLGHISYSSYLLHFPLQLIIVGAAFELAVPRTIFFTPAALVLFFATLIAVSLASYYYFERPVQAWIRKRLMPVRPTAPGGVADPAPASTP